MATTNLIDKSLGNIEIQSGNGTPDHAAPIGTLYTNVDTGTLYSNTVGTATGWDSMNKVAYGEIYLSANTTTTSLTAPNWTIPALTWVKGFCNGTDISGTTALRINSGRAGRYFVILSASVRYSATASSTIDIGLSLNNNTPTDRYINGAYIRNTTNLDRVIVINGYLDLVTNDYLRLNIRTSVTNVVILRNTYLTVYRIGDSV